MPFHPTLCAIRGLPGSGKSSLGALLGNAALKLQIGIIEAALIKDKVVGINEDPCKEAVQRGIGALAAGAGWAQALRIEVVGEAADRNQRVGGRQKGGKTGQNTAALVDELGGQRAVAVERRVATALLDNLERQFMAALGVAGELPCGFLRECVQRGAQLAKAHKRRFAAAAADPAVIAAR